MILRIKNFSKIINSCLSTKLVRRFNFPLDYSSHGNYSLKNMATANFSSSPSTSTDTPSVLSKGLNRLVNEKSPYLQVTSNFKINYWFSN